MNQTFAPAMTLLLVHEGGFVDNPADPGGMTNLGVTRRAWQAYTGHAVNETDMRALTPLDVTPFYETRYWNVIRGDDLPAGVDFCTFDTCVNSGPNRAVILLQEALGIARDGRIGPLTLAAATAQPAATTIAAYTIGRLAYLKSLPTWNTFGKGWTTRVEEVEQEALALASTFYKGVP